MIEEPGAIQISEDSEVGHLLSKVDGAPLRLELNGVVYRVIREDVERATYDPEKVRAAVRAAQGTLTPEEGEALKAYIYRGREEGSRPANRP